MNQPIVTEKEGPASPSGTPDAFALHLDWLTLRFSGPEAGLEATFLDYYSFRSIRYARFAILMGALLIGLFGILDQFLAPQHTRFLWSIRFGILCPCALLTAATTYWKRLVPWLPGFQVFLLLLTASGFTAMVMYSPVPVNYLYYSGLILVLMYGYTFLRLRFIWGALSGWLIVCIYILAAKWKAGLPLPIFINNIFFLVAANFIGMMASYSIEYYARNDFYLMRRMKDTQEEMAGLNLILDARVKERTAELEANNGQLNGEIQERKAAEEALRESETKNRALLEAIPDLVFTNRRNGEYLAVHASDPGLLLLVPDSFLHRKIPEVLPGPFAAQFMAAIGEALDANRVVELTYSLAIEGEERQFEARVVPSTEDTVLTIVRDITERSRARSEQARLEARLQQSQKMESLGTLAGGLAHDMNNVLGAILSLASSHLEFHPAGSHAHRAFDIIAKAATRGGDMVRSLLSFARQSPVELQDCDVNGILRDELRILERTSPANLRFELDLEPDLRPIRGDASALSHAFMNLSINALDAMPEQGTLRLRSRNLDQDWIEIRVEDTGTGMSREVLERALEPFFTTKLTGKGTGLGLSMVYSTVKAHKGLIDIQSEPGRGTQVSVRLPACAPSLQVALPSLATHAGRAAPVLKVLLVDDDVLIQGAVESILQSLGHSVVVTHTGEAALSVIETGFEPDVVLLDMNMPGLGGSGTLPRLRALRPLVPVLLSTGRADQTALDLAMAHPHVNLLPKPFSLADLRKSLESLRPARS